MSDPIRVVFAIYPGVTQLDFTGPYQVLVRTPGVKVRVASVGGRVVEGDGLFFANLAVLEEIDACDVLCIPGGGGVTEAMEDATYMHAVCRLAATARTITSVCTRSLVLAAAGLLKGRRAACHWAWRDTLALFGAIPDAGRVVRDGNILTGGGVTAGIDFALALVAELTNAETAQAVQLGLEYAPAPPFSAGRPETAPPQVLARVLARNAEALPSRRAIIERIAEGVRRRQDG